MNEQILKVCMELIDDAKKGCADIVFKEICLEVLSRARVVLTETQFKHLVTYVSEKIQEKLPFDLQEKLTVSS
ncbi:MAG: hypothetical protein PVF96_00045 [Candidatus Bathyarchaeota archaeon]